QPGWDGSPMPPGLMKKYPPGFNSWSVGQRQRWELDLNLAKQHVHIEVIKYRGRSQQDIISAEISVEAAARSGVPIANVESLVVDCVRRGFDSDTIEKASRALTYGVGRGKYKREVGSAARARIDAGVSGDSLAKDIYKNILLQEYENKIEQQKPRKNKQQK
ncbi:MAG: hypothetical protein M1269_05805, partial [Chloroflexi bacterium]|nr:hypothetical protein [Chloroflexota bacterium]